MFDELTEELLDLSANVRGYGAAVYAQVEYTPSCSCNSCSLCSTIVLCCGLTF